MEVGANVFFETSFPLSVSDISYTEKSSCDSHIPIEKFFEMAKNNNKTIITNFKKAIYRDFKIRTKCNIRNSILNFKIMMIK